MIPPRPEPDDSALLKLKRFRIPPFYSASDVTTDRKEKRDDFSSLSPTLLAGDVLVRPSPVEDGANLVLVTHCQPSSLSSTRQDDLPIRMERRENLGSKSVPRRLVH